MVFDAHFPQCKFLMFKHYNFFVSVLPKEVLLILTQAGELMGHGHSTRNSSGPRSEGIPEFPNKQTSQRTNSNICKYFLINNIQKWHLRSQIQAFATSSSLTNAQKMTIKNYQHQFTCQTEHSIPTSVLQISSITLNLSERVVIGTKFALIKRVKYPSIGSPQPCEIRGTSFQATRSWFLVVNRTYHDRWWSSWDLELGAGLPWESLRCWWGRGIHQCYISTVGRFAPLQQQLKTAQTMIGLKQIYSSNCFND